MTAGASGAAVHRTDLLGSRRRIGPYERHVQDPSRPELVYGAYLSLLHAVGGARPGERLALRAADLDALLPLLDPHTTRTRHAAPGRQVPRDRRVVRASCAPGLPPVAAAELHTALETAAALIRPEVVVGRAGWSSKKVTREGECSGTAFR